jgi:hypothetical protein
MESNGSTYQPIIFGKIKPKLIVEDYEEEKKMPVNVDHDNLYS